MSGWSNELRFVPGSLMEGFCCATCGGRHASGRCPEQVPGGWWRRPWQCPVCGGAGHVPEPSAATVPLIRLCNACVSTVTLEEDYRDDDIERLVTAIRQLRGVASVHQHVTDLADHFARERISYEWAQRFYQFGRHLSDGKPDGGR